MRTSARPAAAAPRRSRGCGPVDRVVDRASASAFQPLASTAWRTVAGSDASGTWPGDRQRARRSAVRALRNGPQVATGPRTTVARHGRGQHGVAAVADPACRPEGRAVARRRRPPGPEAVDDGVDRLAGPAWAATGPGAGRRATAGGDEAVVPAVVGPTRTRRADPPLVEPVGEHGRGRARPRRPATGCDRRGRGPRRRPATRRLQARLRRPAATASWAADLVPPPATGRDPRRTAATLRHPALTRRRVPPPVAVGPGR